jgi:hypothetical protein
MIRFTRWLTAARPAGGDPAAAARGDAAGAQNVFRLYTSLTGAEIINDLKNPTGGQFTTATLKTYVLGSGNILTVPNGGTGRATLTNHGVLVGAATTAITQLTAGTTGQLLVGATGADPAFGTTLAGDYTLSGANTFSGINTFTASRNQLGSASGVPSHIATAQTTAPALTSCGGGSPAITGTDTAGIVTMGTSATGCVITFNVAYTGTPYCVVSWIATPLASQSYATSNTAITLTQTSTSATRSSMSASRRPAANLESVTIPAL